MEKMREYMDRMYDEMWSEETCDDEWRDLDERLYTMSQEDEDAFDEWADAHSVDIYSEEGYEDFCQWCWDHE